MSKFFQAKKRSIRLLIVVYLSVSLLLGIMPPLPQTLPISLDKAFASSLKSLFGSLGKSGDRIVDKTQKNSSDMNRKMINNTTGDKSLGGKDQAKMEKALAGMKTPFIANEGQIADKTVKYYANIFAGSLFVAEDGVITYAIKAPKAQKKEKSIAQIEKGVDNPEAQLKQAQAQEQEDSLAWSVKEKLLGAKTPKIQAVKENKTKVSYFIGNDPSEWRTDVDNCESVSLGEVYPSVNLTLRTRSNNVEKVFTINPGGDPNDIKVKLGGVQSLSINSKGELEMTTGIGPVGFTKPVAYQYVDGIKKNVMAEYRMEGNTYGFELGTYDKKLPLVIDPLLASTFVGNGDGYGYGYGYVGDKNSNIITDNQDNVYITGNTESLSFPTTPGAFDNIASQHNIFVSKLSSDLTTLLSSTFLGGTDTQRLLAQGIAIDSQGNVYIVGYTESSNFPVTIGAYDTTHNGSDDAFVSKLNSELTTLVASTFIGGSSLDYDIGIAIDSQDNACITGFTWSADFPSTSGVYDEVFNYVPVYNPFSIFISKFDANLATLLASTFFGGDGYYSQSKSIEVDTQDNIYITGFTLFSDFPTTPGAYDTTFNGANSTFVSKFSPDLTTLLASTFLGGGNPYGVNIDAQNNVFVYGETSSSDFPTTSNAYDSIFDYDSTMPDGGACFISKFNSDLTILRASTFLDLCQPSDIALDSEGYVFLTGRTVGSTVVGGGIITSSIESTFHTAGETYTVEFPTTPGAYDTTFNGYQDVFISKFNPNLSILYASTFIGGDAYEESKGITVDSQGNVYIVGYTESQNYPTTSGAYNTVFDGMSSVFVSTLTDDLSGDETIPQISGNSPAATENLMKRSEYHIAAASKVADPIDASSGAHTLEKSFLKQNGMQSFDFSINYNSLLLNQGPLGKGWGHDYETKITTDTSGNVDLWWSANKVNHFTKNPDGTFSSSETAAKFDKLDYFDNDGFGLNGFYVLTRPDQSSYIFSNDGLLRYIFNKTHLQYIFLDYDSFGRLSFIIDPFSMLGFQITYNDHDFIETITDIQGRQITFAYDDDNNLINVNDANGQATSFSYNETGQVLNSVDPEGVTVFQNVYDEFGRVIIQDDSNPENQLTTFTYDESSTPGQLITTVTDRCGNTKVLTHDDRYQLLSITDELGQTAATYTYDDDGNRITATDTLGHTTRYGYDVIGNMTSIIDAKDSTTTMTYDEFNNLTSMENALGQTITYTNDMFNNLITVTDPQENTTTNAYEQNTALLSSTTLPRGGTTHYYYSPEGHGLPTTIVNPSESTTTLSYDNAGRLISTTDALSNETTMTYDEVDNLLAVTDPLGNTTSFTYDCYGNKLSSTDPKGNTTYYTYSVNGKLATVTDPLGNVTTYQYDGEDRLIKTIDAKGHETTFTYDAKGRLISATDPLGHTTTTTYDALDNVISQEDTYGTKILEISYDALNNPITTKDAQGNTTTNTYDTLNRLSSTADPLGRISTYTYDALGRLILTTDPAEAPSTQTFDEDGNMVSVTDPNNNKTLFTYDQADRLMTQETSVSATSYTYNAKDLIKETTNARGQKTSFTYDAAGRISTMATQEDTTTYTYDANSNVTQVSDSKGTITRTFDVLNRVLTYTDVYGDTISYTYDEVGNLTKLTYPDEREVTYTYDAADRMIKVTDWAGRETSYEYDNNDRLTKTIRPNGTTLTLTYNTEGELVHQKDEKQDEATIAEYTYTYDAAGQITTEQDSREDTGTIESATMTYGPDNRIATYNDQQVTFDPDGNMTSGPLNGTMQDFTYDSKNRLTQAGSTRYTYDAENNRIAASQDETQTIKYTINPNASLSQLLIKTDPNGSKTYYIYGLGLIAEEEDNQSTTYKTYHFDKRGSTVAITDELGNTTGEIYYGPYGEILAESGDTNTPYKFNGQYGVMTDENGLYYMRARYYSPEVKRFVNQDVLLGSIDNSQSLNRYAYVNGNPVSYVDPMGYLRGPGRVNGKWYADPDAAEFGSNSVTYNALKILGDNWVAAKDVIDRNVISGLAYDVRRISRNLNLRRNGVKAPKSVNGMPLNEVERILYEDNPTSGINMLTNAGIAFYESLLRFDEKNDDNNGNAFRHAYWNARMARYMGPSSAKKWADAHEYGRKGNLAGFEKQAEMDLWNNYIGRWIGRNESIFSNSADDVINAVVTGQLRRIVKGKLVPTDDSTFSWKQHIIFR